MSEVQTQIYTTSFLSIYKTSTSQGQIRCTYVRRYISDEAAATAAQQLQSLISLGHPSICQVYEVKAEKGRRVRVETEWSGEDLASMPADYVWTQDSCWALLYYMTSALAHAQRQGISHGSLLPYCMGMSEGGIYKLTGFLCPERPRKGETLWEVTEPFYLSPELRSAYARLLVGEDIGQLHYNPYKSDVYSLGLILVSLLSPSSLPQLGSENTVNVTVSSLPVHPDMQRLLLYILATDPCNRPDWLELEPILHQMQGTESKEEQKVDVQPEALNPEKKRLRIIKKRESGAKLPVSGPSTDLPSNLKVCPRCNKSFHLNTSEGWRLDLIGSIDCEPAAKYCSSSCFLPASPSSVQPSVFQEQPVESRKISLNLKSVSGRPLSSAQLQMIQSNLIVEGQKEFFHCLRHTGTLPNPEFNSTPTVLFQCPDCPAGEIREEVIEPLQVCLAINSMYPSLVFVQKRVLIRQFNIEMWIYIPVAASFRDTLINAKCHICGKSISRESWICFFHAQRTDLVCSSECLLKGTRSELCPRCGDSTGIGSGLVTEEAAERLQRSVSIMDESSCLLCLSAHADYVLSCGCLFCISCFSIIPNYSDIDSFSCFSCGMIMRKDENRDLMEMLGRAS